MSKRKSFKPYLKFVYEGTNYGIIGEATAHTLSGGEPLFVGDIVGCTKLGFTTNDNFIFKPKEFPNGSVLGYGSTIFVNGEANGVRIHKIKSFADLTNGEGTEDIIAVLEDDK